MRVHFPTPNHCTIQKSTVNGADGPEPVSAHAGLVFLSLPMSLRWPSTLCEGMLPLSAVDPTPSSYTTRGTRARISETTS